MPSHRRDEKREALIRAKVERAMDKWQGRAPPHMLAKMREIAEEYYRTDPVAVRVINVLLSATGGKSGLQCHLPGQEEPAHAKKGASGQ